METVERAVEGDVPVAVTRKRRARCTEEIPTEAAEPISEDERKLEERIAAKKERAAALEAEYAEHKRIRAHLSDLMSHNLASLDQVARELDELESMRQQIRRIRIALDQG